jgi:DNA-binding response OmpR family regulator
LGTPGSVRKLSLTAIQQSHRPLPTGTTKSCHRYFAINLSFLRGARPAGSAAFNRRSMRSDVIVTQSVFSVFDCVDLVRGAVRVEGDVKLSPKEYELLRILVQHAGEVLNHKILLKKLWDDFTDTQYLRVLARQLRQKIEADHERPQFVVTETGIGYRLRGPD